METKHLHFSHSIYQLYTPTIGQLISKRKKSRKGSWEKCINTIKSQTYTVEAYMNRARLVMGNTLRVLL